MLYLYGQFEQTLNSSQSFQRSLGSAILSPARPYSRGLGKGGDWWIWQSTVGNWGSVGYLFFLSPPAFSCFVWSDRFYLLSPREFSLRGSRRELREGKICERSFSTRGSRGIDRYRTRTRGIIGPNSDPPESDEAKAQWPSIDLSSMGWGSFSFFRVRNQGRHGPPKEQAWRGKMPPDRSIPSFVMYLMERLWALAKPAYKTTKPFFFFSKLLKPWAAGPTCHRLVFSGPIGKSYSVIIL